MLFTPILWLDILILVGIIICILVIYKFIVFLIKRAAKSGRIPPDVVNGLKLLVRLIVVIIIIILVISFTPLPPEVTLAISAIIGTVIGFASIQAIQNFISGLYIIITRPFGINDFIAIDDLEGVVSEISLNYTKVVSVSGKRMLISNRNVLNSNIVNYTRPAVLKPEHKASGFQLIKHIIAGDDITRYTFSLNLPKDNPVKVKKVLNAIADEWESKLGYRPEFMLWALNNFAVFRFVLKADKPETILQHRPLFIKEIYRRLFSKQL